LNASIENKSPHTQFQSKLEDEIRCKGKELRNGETCRKAKKLYLENLQNPYIEALHGYIKSLNRLKLDTEDKLQRN
jgi:hypothetical protein